MRNIPSPIVLFLQFEQPYIEQFFKTKELHVKNIPTKMIYLQREFTGVSRLLFSSDDGLKECMAATAQLHPNCVSPISKHEESL